MLLIIGHAFSLLWWVWPQFIVGSIFDENIDHVCWVDNSIFRKDNLGGINKWLHKSKITRACLTCKIMWYMYQNNRTRKGAKSKLSHLRAATVVIRLTCKPVQKCSRLRHEIEWRKSRRKGTMNEREVYGNGGALSENSRVLSC